MAAGSGAVLTSFIINLVTAAICFAVFSYLRIQGWARRFFAPRRCVTCQDHMLVLCTYCQASGRMDLSFGIAKAAAGAPSRSDNRPNTQSTAA